jgi:ubiquinone/menaquinone biosynthesis C-methylase UbiE
MKTPVLPSSPAVSLPASSLTKLAYQAVQWGRNSFSITHRTWSRQLRESLGLLSTHPIQPITPEQIALIKQRFDHLLNIDWADAEAGLYPASQLFDNAWDEFIRYYPQVWWDAPHTWQRMSQRQAHEFAPELDLEGYPSYYLQNFHYQTDGYLGETSANLYDIQTELLFGGMTDAMRRRTIAPLKQGLSKFSAVPQKQLRVLDVACGTGRTLRQLRGALPQVSLHGMDLSPAYLRKANQGLSCLPGELPQLMQANAESLPYRDEYFHAVVCVFLFHELPAGVRQRVIEECFRVVRWGGTFVICDSIQTSDSPELVPIMENFSASLHEPYYRHYMSDDLEARLQTAGFTQVQTQVHFMSKYWIAQKAG